MRRVFLAVVVFAACANYGEDDADKPPVDLPDASGVDGGRDAPADTNSTNEASPPDAGTDADASSGIPFEDRLVLRFETDHADGITQSGLWNDLSKGKHAVTLAGGAPKIEATPSGAKVMAFDTATGPIFDVADHADLQFGSTDDFFVVVRATLNAPNETGGGCTFRYLFAKYDPDGTTAATVRACNENFGRKVTGALKFGITTESTVQYPGSLELTYGVLSFGRNQSGTRIETYAAGASFEQTAVPLVNVSAVGSPFVVGGYRYLGTQAAAGGYTGKVNRLYVYHAPGGTFAKADYDAIRNWVATVKPIP